jgi:hypothetical protein
MFKKFYFGLFETKRSVWYGYVKRMGGNIWSKQVPPEVSERGGPGVG